MENNNRRITESLLNLKKQINSDYLFPILIPDARELVPSNPYAFCIACSLDRGTRAEIVWTIPYWIKIIVGHFDPMKFYTMSIDEIIDIFNQLPKKPHYINTAPRTFQSITNIVIEKFEGNASKIWEGQKAFEVKKTFMKVYGVGVGISNMAVILIENAYGFHFSDIDHRRMGIKPDVHTMRVLYRLGIAAYIEENEAISAARLLNPEYPGEIDGPLWLIGRNWCKPNSPLCGECYLKDSCLKIEVK
jgi:endonuclease III